MPEEVRGNYMPLLIMRLTRLTTLFFRRKLGLDPDRRNAPCITFRKKVSRIDVGKRNRES